ncbi:hypothetical protein CBR_g50168 [Chara braunii]|uniref:Uncharacterized protein n=1 Tax=Chara braunii TaxID=69332 RepID=A0A388M6E1_CHABU|nr:hypothetical protein CBR_g50168 [Chara braunii]|eukprot:GBG90075.1 hypothetical protein CBR_g50168 [Chara braunii]
MDVGFDVSKERRPVQVTGDSVKGFLETEVSSSLGVVVLSQEVGTETADGRDAKAAGSFGVDVKKMVDEGVVKDNVKVAEFGVGRSEVGAEGVAMDEMMLKRLGDIDMSHCSKDFLKGLVIGSARERIGSTIGLAGSMADDEYTWRESLASGPMRGNILFGEDAEDDGVAGANGEVLAIEVRLEDKDVVEVGHDTNFEEITKDVVHGGLEGRWGICEAERHHKELVMPKARAEGGLVGIFLANTDLVEATAKVNLGEVFGSVEAIKKFIYSGSGYLFFIMIQFKAR